MSSEVLHIFFFLIFEVLHVFASINGIVLKHFLLVMGHGGLECCDSWGRKESDTTERLK